METEQLDSQERAYVSIIEKLYKVRMASVDCSIELHEGI